MRILSLDTIEKVRRRWRYNSWNRQQWVAQYWGFIDGDSRAKSCE